MTIATTRPNSTPRLGYTTVTGAATADAALAAPSGYVEVGGTYGDLSLLVGFPVPSLPAGATVVAAVIRIQAESGWPSGTDIACTLGSLIAIGGQSAAAAMDVGSLYNGSAVSIYVTDDSAPQAAFWTGNAVAGRIYQAWLDVYYVAKPTVVVNNPTGTYTETNKPTVTWTPTLDVLAPTQREWQAKIFDSATYGGGGFSADTSGDTTTSYATNSAQSWQVDKALSNGTYRAYVKVACDVNGSSFWSDWAYSQFIVNVVPPGPPTMSLTDLEASGRVSIAISPAGSGVTTNGFLLERSTPTGWVTAVEASTGTAQTVYDYEVQPGLLQSYRLSAWHNTASGRLYSYSSATASITPSGNRWWIKILANPFANIELALRSNPTVTRAARQGISQPLGRSLPVIVSDTRLSATGEIVFKVTGIAALETVDALLASGGPFLLSGPWSQNWRNRHVVFGDLSQTRIVDNGVVSSVFDVTVPWTEVARP